MMKTKPSFRQHLIAFWQVSRNISFVLFMVMLCAAALIVPDQAQDMIDEFGQQHILRDYFLLKSLSVCIWTATAWQCARIILLAPVDIDIAENRAGSEFWMLWLPRFVGLIAGLTLGLAFLVDGHGWHGLVILGYTVATVAGLIFVENRNQALSDYQQPVRESFRTHSDSGERKYKDNKPPRTTVREDLRELLDHKLIRNLLYFGFGFMMILFLLFLIPLITGSARIGQFFSAVYIVLLGCSFYCGFGSLVVYFSDFRYRPIALAVAIGLYFISAFNDNSLIRECKSEPQNRTEIRDQFARWLVARKVNQKDTIPLIIVATEGGGIRATVWTSQLLFRLNEKIPGFDQHTFAISGVSGGGVGAAFYLAYLRDGAANPVDTLFSKGTLDNVLKEDFISPVIGGFMFNEPIQLPFPFPICNLERTKRLEDAWAQAYSTAFNAGKEHENIDTFNQPFTSIFAKGDSCVIPSLILNGTLAETGQKTIVSNLIVGGKQNFKDVVDVFQLTRRDMPLKTAATMCSRFPFVTTGGSITARNDSAYGIRTGHVTDGGNFDNTGMETAIQLLTSLMPGIEALRKEDIHIVPYILFFKNSESEELSNPEAIYALRRNRGFGVPANSFFNPWNRGSDTRDALYQGLTPYTTPQIRYMSFKLDYRLNDQTTLRLPLGWSISDSATNHIHARADSLIEKKVLRGDLNELRKLIRIKSKDTVAAIPKEYFLGRIPELALEPPRTKIRKKR